MENSQRKATDVLLDLEKKVDYLSKMVDNLNNNVKLLLNKLNETPQQVYQPQPLQPKFTASVSDNESNLEFKAENLMKIEDSPVGFPRTSRAEGYVPEKQLNSTSKIVGNLTNEEDSFLPLQINPVTSQNSKAPPGRRNADELKNNDLKKEEPLIIKKEVEELSPVNDSDLNYTGNKIPIIQRVVNANNKSVFLADVEIFNKDNVLINKIKTNGSGKWTALLDPGSYKISIKRKEALNQKLLEVNQNIIIDGSKESYELPIIILK